jgi:hypothetical protein
MERERKEAIERGPFKVKVATGISLMPTEPNSNLTKPTSNLTKPNSNLTKPKSANSDEAKTTKTVTLHN